MLKKRSFNFGWLKGNTADIASLIDIYVDTIPFGSGLTAAECILSNGCYLGTISHINKEASFTNILTDALNLVNDNKVPYNSNIPDCGLFVDFNECIDHASSLYNDNQKKLNLRNVQVKLLKNLDKLGSEHFSKDYLQFFSR